MYLKLTV
jgi:hypothetical protein